MTSQEVKKKVKEFKYRFQLSDCNYKSLKEAIEKQGYTIVEFNHIYNDNNVQTLIDALNLSDVILSTKGFTYADKHYRLVFVHEDLSEQEKILILAHENGHIFLDHISVVSVIGKEVREEYEANEFVHYLLENTTSTRILEKFHKQQKVMIGIFLTLILLFIGTVCFIRLNKEQKYYGEYYITTTGNKYHEKECIFVKGKTNVKRLTKEEFEGGEFEACKICLP